MLLGADISALERIEQGGGSILVMRHYSRAGNFGGTRWFFDHMDARQVPYDLIGLSYYPWWHGSLAVPGRTWQRRGVVVPGGDRSAGPVRLGRWFVGAVRRRRQRPARGVGVQPR